MDPNTHASSLDEKEGPKNAEYIEDRDPDAGLSDEERAKIVGSHSRRVYPANKKAADGACVVFRIAI